MWLALPFGMHVNLCTARKHEEKNILGDLQTGRLTFIGSVHLASFPRSFSEHGNDGETNSMLNGNQNERYDAGRLFSD